MEIGYFDLITVFQVSEYANNPIYFLTTLGKYLKPDERIRTEFNLMDPKSRRRIQINSKEL